jgi:very-short-patch-repair endonuclease
VARRSRDGGRECERIQQRQKQKAKDNARTKALQSMDLNVLRICNRDVDRHFTDVCEMINNYVKASLPQSAMPTAPSSEGA